MHILIDRDAVCAADDMSHHREKFTVPDDITIAGLFELLEFKYIQCHSCDWRIRGYRASYRT